jgi:DNA-binding CsgD family transcriptional regulator
LACRPRTQLRHDENGSQGTPGPGPPPEQLLSPQELQVSSLVGEGLTNREAAERLIVSTKTVEYHLGNAYRKLGVRSRVELVKRLDAR